MPESVQSNKSNVNAPLGIRNNNPLNIRVSSNAWQGKISSDNGFEKFSDIKFGIRAAVINLRTYYKRDGLTSVSKIINKWAPPIENHTANYIKFVADEIGYNSIDILPYTPDVFASLVSSMSAMENGKSYRIPKSDVLNVIEEFRLIV